LTKSENVSKSGVAFSASKRFEVSEALQIICPYNPGENLEVRSRVRRRCGGAGGERYLYGAQYEGCSSVAAVSEFALNLAHPLPEDKMS